MRTAEQWRVVAWFDNHDQAKQAALHLIAIQPRAYEFSALTKEGVAVWRETGQDYGANDVQL